MSQKDITRIKINKNSIGIFGLSQVLEEMSKEYAQRPDHEVQTEMLNRLSTKNYIPPGVKEEYGKALLREFKKFMGRPYEEEVTGELEIKVLGPGCSRCDMLEKELMKIMAEMNISADVEHVTDIKEIAGYGVMGTPALLINGKVMAVGNVPPKAKIKEWLSKFL